MHEQPTRADLDALPTERPLLVVALDGHIAVANSRALALAGVAAGTADPPGGVILRDAAGEPTGILHDAAIALLEQRDARALGRAGRRRAARGARGARPLRRHLLHGRLRLRAGARRGGRAERRGRAARARLGGGHHQPEQAEDPDAMLAHLERPARGVRAARRDRAHREVLPRRRDRAPDADRGDARALPGADGGRRLGPRRRAPGRPTSRSPCSTARSRRSTRPAGRSTSTRSATARRARRSTRSQPRASATARRGSATRSPTSRCSHPDDIRALRRARRARRPAAPVGAARPVHGRPPAALPGRGALAPALSRARARAAGALLCGGSDWPVDPLLPFKQISGAVLRGAVGRRGRAAAPRGGDHAAGRAGDAHAQQRLPAAPGGS